MHFGVVFSRFQAKKIYVQDKVREASALVWQALESGGVIMVSGSSEKMPQDVREVRCKMLSRTYTHTANTHTQYMYMPCA
jgi:sulfite reductase (NADPH) flavoprotein alpha-component